MTKFDDPRRLILNAARRRFTEFGYMKTAMAEIAQDCDMSVGNLYRFFESKIDLACAVVVEDEQAFFDRLQGFFDPARGSADERLGAYLEARCEMTFEIMERRKTVVEIARLIEIERPEIIHRSYARQRKQIRDILEQGIASGEFEMDDSEEMAKAIQFATHIFVFPQLYGRDTLDLAMRDLSAVKRLVLQSVRAPLHVKAPPGRPVTLSPE